MGDNRLASRDSRQFGLISTDYVIGKASKNREYLSKSARS